MCDQSVIQLHQTGSRVRVTCDLIVNMMNMKTCELSYEVSGKTPYGVDVGADPSQWSTTFSSWIRNCVTGLLGPRCGALRTDPVPLDSSSSMYSPWLPKLKLYQSNSSNPACHHANQRLNHQSKWSYVGIHAAMVMVTVFKFYSYDLWLISFWDHIHWVIDIFPTEFDSMIYWTHWIWIGELMGVMNPMNKYKKPWIIKFWLVSNVSKEHQLEVAGKLTHLQRVILGRDQDCCWFIDAPKNFLDDRLVFAGSRFQFFQLDEQPVLVLALRFPASGCGTGKYMSSLLCTRTTVTAGYNQGEGEKTLLKYSTCCWAPNMLYYISILVHRA